MALPAHVQSSGWTVDTSDVVVLTVVGVVTGNALLVAISQSSSPARTYTVTDASGNTYTQRQRIAPGRVTEIWSAANVNGGTVVITITASAGSIFNALAVEVGNIDPTTSFDVADQLSMGAGTTSHFSAPSTAIDTTTDVYCLSTANLNGASGGFTPGTNWTTLTASANDLAVAQYRISASALADERGAWTSGTGRSSDCAIASFKGTAGAGGSVVPILSKHYRERRA